MRKWLVRGLLPIWALIYLIIFRSGVPTTLALVLLGLLKGALLVFLAVSIWGIVFYILLCEEEGLDNVREHIAQLARRQGDAKEACARVGRSLAIKEPLLSLLWLIPIFIFLDMLLGVLAVRLFYSGEVSKRSLAIVWFGAAIDVLFWVLVWGGPAIFARGLIGL